VSGSEKKISFFFFVPTINCSLTIAMAIAS